MNFVNQFMAARRVSTPLVCIRTFDAKSTTNTIKTALGEELKDTGLVVWDAIHGLTPLNNTDKSKNSANKLLGGEGQGMSEVFVNAIRMCNTDEVDDSIIFVANAHLQWKTEPAAIQGIWNLRDKYKANGNMLVLLALPGSILPPELTSDVLVLDEPLPTVEELRQTVRDTYSFAKVPDGQLTDDVLKAATSALIGLPQFPAEQSTAMCLELTKDKQKIVTAGTLNIDDLWQRKREIVNSTPGLSVYEGKETLDDIGGVQQAKEFFREIMEGNTAPDIFLFMDEIEKGLAGSGTDLSGVKTELNGSLLKWLQDRKIKGVMSIGIPGVSKSALIKALGNTYGKPVIIFDIAAMQGSLIGESGGNMRKAQTVVEAIAGGGRIMAIATCNGIATLSPEMRRRFAYAQFFYDAPSEEEKKDIWKIHRAKQGLTSAEANPEARGWTGAEIENCCEKAADLNLTLAKASQYIVPMTISAADKIRETRMGASGKFLSASKPGIYDYRETEAPSKSITPPQYTEGRKMRD